MSQENNIFAKIIREEIKAEKIHENNYFICIKDINPKAKHHYLVISKDYIKDFNNMKNFEKFHEFILEICEKNNLKNYQIVTNIGTYQEIPHLHFHILSND